MFKQMRPEFSLSLGICAVSGLLGLSGPAFSQADFPSRPIAVVLGVGAGGSSDASVRIVAEKMTSVLGTNVVVENRTGAGGRIAARHVATSRPDGYTLYGGALTLINLALTEGKLGFNAEKDLVPVGFFSKFNGVLTVDADSKFKTAKDLLDEMRAKPDSVNFGSVGAPSSNGGGVAAAWFAHLSGKKIVGISYPGSGQALADLIGGRLTYMFPSPATIAGAVAAGQVRVLAVAGATRVPAFPDVPTMAEAGLGDFMAINWDQWVALFAPAATPEPVLQKLSDALNKAISDQEVKSKLNKMGLYTFEPRTTAAATAFWKSHFQQDQYPSLLSKLGYLLPAQPR